jgi:hypothetical protein
MGVHVVTTTVKVRWEHRVRWTIYCHLILIKVQYQNCATGQKRIVRIVRYEMCYRDAYLVDSGM